MKTIFTIFMVITFLSCETKPKENKKTETVRIPIGNPNLFYVDPEWTEICETVAPKDGGSAIDFDIQSDSVQLSNKKIPLLKRIEFTSSNDEIILTLNIYNIEDKDAILKESPSELSCFKGSIVSTKYFYMADTCKSVCFDKNSEYDYDSFVNKIKQVVK